MEEQSEPGATGGHASVTREDEKHSAIVVMVGGRPTRGQLAETWRETKGVNAKC
jgi:hypothetical protein